MLSAFSACPIQRMQCASRAGPSRYWPSRCPWPRPPRMLSFGTRRPLMRISQWLCPPLIVSTSRTTSQPSEGMSTRKAEFAACGTSGSSSVRAIRIANFAPRAPEMNHLWPSITHASPSSRARVWISVGSEPATSGSVIAKHERMCPLQSGFRYFFFCSGVAQWCSVCMLPSSGACAFSAKGPKPLFAASAETAAIATCPSPMPPYSSGMCGSQSPHSRACLRMWMICSISTSRLSPLASIFSSAGRTTSLMNLRTRATTCWTSSGKLKSMAMGLLSRTPQYARAGAPWGRASPLHPRRGAYGAAVEAQAEQYVEDPECDRVRPDQPQHGERAGAWPQQEQQAERERGGAAEREEPLVLDLLPERDRRGDLEHARRHRPDRDVEEQRQRRDARREEREDADADPDHTLEREQPPGRGPLAAEGRDQREHPVDERVRAEEDHERRQRDGRPEEGGDAEQDGQHAAEHQHPPVSGEPFSEHRGSFRSPPEDSARA